MLFTFKGKSPKLGEGVFVAPGATVLGDVEIGDSSSIWFGAAVRGDVNYIRIGDRVNVQDLATLHCTAEFFPLTIGDDVSIGHNAVVHGCTIGSMSLVGIGARVLDGAVVGERSIVAAGAVVPEGKVFPPGSLLMGAPAKRVREVGEKELSRIIYTRDSYLELSREYLDATEFDNNGLGA